MTLSQQVETRVRETTHGRIRDLKVDDEQGCIVVHGSVPSHHTKQLALQGMLELLAGDTFRAHITVRHQPGRPDSPRVGNGPH